MWIVVILGLVTAVLWYGNKRRGQRFVRAVHFLDLLDSGSSPDEANGNVARLFSKYSTPDADVAAIEHANDRAKRFTDNKQLPWIDEARQRGFIIDGGDARFDMAHLSHAKPQKNSDQFSRAQPALSEAYQAGPDTIRASKGKVVPAFEELIDTAFRWAVRGAMVGFILGLLIPRVGLFGNLEVWAIPIMTGFFGVWGGVAIGASFRVLRWVFSK